MSDPKKRNRQPSGVPVGGEFAGETAASTGVQLTESAVPDEVTSTLAQHTPQWPSTSAEAWGETASCSSCQREMPCDVVVFALALDLPLPEVTTDYLAQQAKRRPSRG